MADQHNIFNEISDLVSWVNESILFETKCKDNINILPESNENIVTQSMKNKKNTDENAKSINKHSRCNLCKVKISLIDDLISTCKCEQKYCSKHRMPEAHLCAKIEEICKEQRRNLEKKLVKLDSKFTQIKI